MKTIIDNVRNFYYIVLNPSRLENELKTAIDNTYSSSAQIKLATLINLGIDLSNIAPQDDIFGCTTFLHHIFAKSNTKVIDLVLSHMVDSTIIDSNSSTLLHFYIQNINNFSTSALYLLLKKGLDINARDIKGNTALHLAYSMLHESNSLDDHKRNRVNDIISILTEFGASNKIVNNRGNLPKQLTYIK